MNELPKGYLEKLWLKCNLIFDVGPSKEIWEHYQQKKKIIHKKFGYL